MPLRPALKQSIPYFTADDAHHFRLAGTLTSLEDPDGKVGELLKLLDGQRTAEQISTELRGRFPELTDGDIAEAIADLDESGLIHDASDTGSDLHPDALERWSRNLGFFETYASLAVSKYEFQRRIRDAKVAVLGIGGVGSHLVLDLVAIGFTDIRILDFDTVELSNLNRQVLYGEPFIGQRKVQVAADRARELNSGIRLEAVDTRLSSADDVYQVVHDRDIVVGSADHPKLDIERWVNAGCVRAGAALISAGVVTQRAFLSTTIPGISGCVECWFTTGQQEDPTTRLVRQDLEATQARGERFAEDTAAFNGLVVLLAAQIVGEAIRLASQICPPVTIGRLVEMAFHDPRPIVTETFTRRADCPVCRNAEPAESLRWLSSDVPLPF
ncbi:MAG TPA: ThiF family adenylyltransferase [Streptosporangiaceae bacterium]|nr:ThiF family adenylyltransferase [Streptosporangiaceae bacterium]